MLYLIAKGGRAMLIHTSCQDAIESCLNTQHFAAAHLYNDERPMKIHIHDCYEIYYSISGGKQFLIDNRFYDFKPGDLFFINQYESHYLSQIDSVTHERIILSIYPDYLKSCCTDQTDLNYCFSSRGHAGGHKVSLTADEQSRFLYYIHKLRDVGTFGQDVLEHALFLELMTFLNKIFYTRNVQTAQAIDASSRSAVLSANTADHEKNPSSRHTQIDAILSYVNQNLTQELTIQNLASHFYLSPSYLCKIFKSETGTTINRYITAKRITHAKALLAEGYSVTDVCPMCGFNDYSNFLKAFTKAVGISPKKYAQFER